MIVWIMAFSNATSVTGLELQVVRRVAAQSLPARVGNDELRTPL